MSLHLLNELDFTTKLSFIEPDIKDNLKPLYKNEYIELMFDEFKNILIEENKKILTQNEKIIKNTSRKNRKKKCDEPITIIRKNVLLEF